MTVLSLTAQTGPISRSRRAAAPLMSTGRILPGIALCLAVTLAAFAIESIEQRVLGRNWLEALVLAILCGTAVRTFWTPSARWCAGIDFSAKTLLEVAVTLLGASISARTLAAVGPALLVGIAGVVATVIPLSFLVCRLLGLPKRMAMLVACGNSICGNSAIAAVAPVIGAEPKDVAASIAFTAVLGVAVVLGLPFLAAGLTMSGAQTGALAGLTVYAVPQVIAAAAPAGVVAVQVGTLVKLVRVLMLGPVVLALSLCCRWFGEAADTPTSRNLAGGKPRRQARSLHRLVPWFIFGFLGLATLNSLGLLPAVTLKPAASLASILTIVSMAALGLGVDVRVVARAGVRVTAAVTVSLAVLGAISLGLIHLIGMT